MKKIRFSTLLIIIVDILMIGAIVFFWPRTDSDLDETAAESQISGASITRICELATLDCYYHNVTEWKYSGNALDPSKKIWMEYEGFVRVGIQGDQVKVSAPDKDGVVTVTMPSARILQKDLDEDTIFEIDSGSRYLGFVPIYAEVTADNRRDALAKAQSEMEAAASRNNKVLIEAQERAKMIIRKNIVALGEMSGKHYTVVFADPSDS